MDVEGPSWPRFSVLDHTPAFATRMSKERERLKIPEEDRCHPRQVGEQQSSEGQLAIWENRACSLVNQLLQARSLLSVSRGYGKF